MRKIFYIIFLCIALPSFLAGCNKDEAEPEPVTPALTPMHQMYNESVTLTEATLDSISSFCDKFYGYVNRNPESKQDQYFNPIIENVQAAAALHGRKMEFGSSSVEVLFDTTWLPGYEVFF